MEQFDFILIKPSHYGDDGYPIVWWKTMIPSNSLAALYGIARDSAERQVLGADVRLNLVPIDETNTHIVPRKIARDIRRRSVKALIGLVGVQSNQYDRALDLTREFRAEGLPVMIGGFHVSGCLSMLKQMPAELKAALDIGCSLFAGECEEGRLDEVLRDAWPESSSRSTTTSTICPGSKAYRCPPCRPIRSSATSRAGRASISGAAARSSAAFVRSSTSRGARAGSAAPMTSRLSSARMSARG
jgi:hypothetical protein